MLTIGLHVKDTNNVKDRTNYVKCLLILHNAAILKKVREVINYFSRPSAILEKVREITNYFSRSSAVLEKVREITNYFSRSSAILEKVREFTIRIFHI